MRHQTKIMCKIYMSWTTGKDPMRWIVKFVCIKNNTNSIINGISYILYCWHICLYCGIKSFPSVCLIYCAMDLLLHEVDVSYTTAMHDDVIKWKQFPRYCPFVRRFHRSPVNYPHKGHWRGALMFSLVCVWINGWVNNREACDLRRYLAHYDVIVMG